MPNIVLYAELIGPNVQKGYEYGVAPGNLEIKIFDISMNGKYLNWGEVEHICQQYKLPLVDSLFQGPFDYDLLNLCEGIDEYNGRKYVREGIVIKPLVERNDQRGNRIIYKKLNPAYLLDKRNTEFH
jgi:ATP-dependent RNA circularization protein (DNA/RNA ligase family)